MVNSLPPKAFSDLLDRRTELVRLTRNSFRGLPVAGCFHILATLLHEKSGLMDQSRLRLESPFAPARPVFSPQEDCDELPAPSSVHPQPRHDMEQGEGICTFIKIQLQLFRLCFSASLIAV